MANKKTNFEVFKEISDLNDPKGIRASINQLLDVQCVRQGGTVKVGVDYNTAQDLMQMVVNGANRYHVLLYVVDAKEFSRLDALPAPDTFERFAEDFVAWSVPTFKHATVIASLKKCSDELQETIECAESLDTTNLAQLATEMADTLMCLLDAAARAGIAPKDLISAAVAKQEINKKRTWSKNPNNSYSHKK